MASMESRRLFGLLLVVLGIGLLLVQLDILDEPEYILSALFFACGAALFASFLRTRQTWKILISGFFLFLGVVLLNEAADLFPDELIGTLFLWMLAVAFFSAFFINRSQWWAIIPGGMLLSIGLLVAGEAYDVAEDEILAAIMMIGFGLTFLVLYLLRNSRMRTEWAIWPSGVFFAIAGIILFQELAPRRLIFSFHSDLLLPLLFIFVGILLVLRAYRQRTGLPTGKDSSKAGEGPSMP